MPRNFTAHLACWCSTNEYSKNAARVAVFSVLYIIKGILWSPFLGLLITSFTAIFWLSTFPGRFCISATSKDSGKQNETDWLRGVYIQNVYTWACLLHLIFDFMVTLLYTESLIYFLVYTSTQVFDRISAPHGVSGEHCEDTWWPPRMGNSRPASNPSGAVTNPSLSGKTNVLGWGVPGVTMHLRKRGISIAGKGQTLKLRVCETRRHMARNNLYLEPVFLSCMLQEYLISNFLVKSTTLICYFYGCLMSVR